MATTGPRLEGKRRRRFAVGLVLALALGSLLPAQVWGAVDAICQEAVNPADASSQDGQARFAQTFRVQQSGQLTRAELKLTGPAADYLVEIRKTKDGKPTAKVLAFKMAEKTGPGDQPLVVNFLAPVPVQAGQRLALSVASNEAAVITRTDNACAGKLFADAVGTNKYVEVPGHDMVFAVFVT